MSTIAPGATKDGSIAAERVDFLIGKQVRVRVWWNREAQQAAPEGDLFQAEFVTVVPIGRDYYFVLLTGPPEHRKRSIIKTAAVLEIQEE